MSSETVYTWKVTDGFARESTTKRAPLELLSTICRQLGIDHILLACGQTHWAVIVSLAALDASFKQGKDQIRIECVTGEEIDRSDNTVFVTTSEENLVTALFSQLQRGAIVAVPPRWLGTVTPSDPHDASRDYLRTRQVEAPSAKLTLQQEGSTPTVFDLYSLSPAPNAIQESLLRNADLHVREDPRNLDRRADWFKRRTGSSQD